jgi:hypothetical protein
MASRACLATLVAGMRAGTSEGHPRSIKLASGSLSNSAHDDGNSRCSIGGRLLAPLTGARAAGDRLAEVIHRLG